MTSKTWLLKHENASCRKITQEKTDLTHENSDLT
jgi:hypothetical protein